MKDLYEVLGIDRNATEKEIKTAYKKAALRTHPDRQHDKTEEEKKQAEEEFKEISKAYDILGNPDKKAKYDNFGIIDDGVSGNSGGFDPFEQFADFFRNSGFSGFNRGRSYNNQPAPGSDIQMRVNLSIEDIYNGCTKTVKYKKHVRCNICHGEGGEGKEQCRYCHGTGMLTQVQQTAFGFSSTSGPCPYCHGSGYSIKHVCQDCGGTGFQDVENVVTVQFPAGIENNRGILFKGEGHESSSPHGANGNFVAISKWDFDEEKFFVSGFDIYEKVSIPWHICIAGGDFKITLPDGTPLNITLKECTKPDAQLRISNKGIKKQGDFYVLVEYDIPDSISKDVKKYLKKLNNGEN